MKKIKIAVIVGVFAGSVLLTVFALAVNAGDNGFRPGWGFGDNNHIHIGPPGHSVIIPPFPNFPF